MSYPEVKIVGISDDAPEFVTDFSEPTPELVEEVLAFYHTTLIPQLACTPDGSFPAIPHENWVTAKDRIRFIVTVRDDDGELHGVWFAREDHDAPERGQIMFPVANNNHIALIYRLLWDETIKHFNYVWAMTDNPVIQAFIKKAVRVPPLPSTPTLNEQGDRLEWRR